MGTDHVLSLSIRYDLANIYVKQHKLDEAEKMYKQILVKDNKAGVLQYKVTLTAMVELGKLYIKQGKLDQGENLYEKTLRIKEK